MVDCIVTTCGGIEEDFIKCIADYYIVSFREDDRDLYENDINRIGNMFLRKKYYY